MDCKSNIEKLADILLDFSQILYLRGCDITRCEDTVHHIAKAYGCNVADIFALPSLMILTIEKDGISISKNRRINSKRSTNFTIVENLNNLSREVCNNPINIDELSNRVNEISKNQISDTQNLIGYFLASAGFVFLYSLNIKTAIISGIFSLFLFYSCKEISKYTDNHTFYVFIVSLVNGLIICLSSKIFVNLDINNIIIGEIMILVPGEAITESVQHLFTGDTTSGQIQFLESLLTAAMLAIGYGIALLVVRVI